MMKSIFIGTGTTPTQLAKEIVFLHGETAVVSLDQILVVHAMTLTSRERGLLVEQIGKILSRIHKNLNCDSITFDEEGALKRMKKEI